jgi:sarcosine oxidase subunit beta
MTSKNFDFLIIGAGFAGCALAYYLTKTGASVLLLESKSICSGSSAACAGRAQIIESESKEYLELVKRGYSKLAGLGQELGVDLEWETRGHLTLLFTPQQWDAHEKMVMNLRETGISAELLDERELRKIEPNIPLNECIGAAYSQEGHLNPFKFCFGFSNAARRHGAEILTNTQVTGFLRSGSRIVGLQAGQVSYYGETILLACGAWTSEISGKTGQMIPIYHTHAEAVVSEPIPKLINHHIGLSGFYEAVHAKQRSVTLGLGQHPNGSLLISNAIQPETEVNLQSSYWGMPAIAKSVLKVFPQLKNVRIMRTWAAPSPFSPDHNPIIGWLPGFDNVYVAAGFHLAIPTIPHLAEEISRTITKSGAKESTLLSPFSPNRFVQTASRSG